MTVELTPIPPENVAIMIGQLGTGGSERQLYFFLHHCDRTRWTPRVYVSGLLGKWADEIQALGIPVVLLRGNRLQKMLQFRAACIAQKASCFFSWSSYTNPYGLALTGLGMRRLGSFRNASFADLPKQSRAAWSYLSVAGASTIVCNSIETRADLAARYGAKKNIVYVANAVQFFTPEQCRTWRQQWRARLGLNEETILVMGTGRLAPQKNFARFIDVIAEVRRHAPIQAAIVGDDFGCMDELKLKARDLSLSDVIHFTGRIPDARELMPAADIFLLSSDHEGMPNVVLEAMSAEAPCVSTPVNGIRELIMHGSNGFVGASDVDELAGYVLRLSLDAELRRSMGERARASIGRFAPERVVPELWRLCEDARNTEVPSTGAFSDFSARADRID